MWQFVKKFTARIIYSIPLWLLVLLGLLAVLQTTTVQTYLAQHATRYLSEKLGFPVQVGYLHVRWPDYVVLRDVLIEDRQHQRMIEVGELQVDFEWATLLDGKNIYLDEVIVRNAHVRLIKSRQSGELNIDQFVAALNKLLNPPTTRKRIGPAPVFEISQIWLNNVQFSYADKRQDTIRKGFDYHHFVLDSIQAVAHRLRFVADTVETHIESLYGQENRTNLDIHRLATHLVYTKKSISLTQLKLDIGNSSIRESVVFSYEKATDMGYFVDKVTMKAKLRDTRIYSKDLALFAPYLNRFEEYWSVTGDFSGKVGRFRLRNADLQFGQGSKVRGNISFEGLPDVRETLIDFDLKPSVLATSDLEQYLDSSAYQTARKFGLVRLKGKFLGFPQDFVANGSFDTDLGTVVSDINLKLGGKNRKSTYKGRLTTRNFDIGTLTEQPQLVQRLDMSGEIEGTGLSVPTADFRLKASVQRIGFQFYDYNNITIDGRLSQQQFNGNVAIKDSNLVFVASGGMDLRPGRKMLDIRADLQKANLRALKLTASEAVVRTKLDIRTRGFALDEIVGEAIFTGGNILYRGKQLIVDSLAVRSVLDSGRRTLNIRSGFADLDAAGNFNFTRLATDFRQLIEEYRLNFSNNAAAIKKYYARKSTNPAARYRLDYNAHLKDINPVLLMLQPDWYIAKNTRLDGSFSKGRTATVTLHSEVDTLSYQNNSFYGSVIDLNTSKLADSTEVLAATQIHSNRLRLGTSKLENLDLEAIWNGKHIEFTGKVNQADSPNLADLRGDVEFKPDRIEVRFKPSRFQAFQNEWRIAANNLVTVKGREIRFDSLQFDNGYQAISLNGTISDDSSQVARLSLRDFNLQTLNPLTDRQLLGTANGFVEIKDFYKTRNLESELTVEELVIDKFLVGDIIGDAHWNEQAKKINVNYQVYRMDQRIVRLYGTYDPRATENALDLNAVLDRANLEILEPFLSGQVSRLGGTANGELQLSGTLAAPILKGEAMVYNGRFRYNYLNTTYYFDDKIYFTENEIGVRNLQLRDEDDNVALMRGGVFHDGFKNFVLDLSGRMKNFKVLNTTLKDNELFYGTAYVTGDMDLIGSVRNLVIRADARTNRGTKIAIPIADRRSVAQQEHIRFVSQNQPGRDTANVRKKEQVNLSGVRMDFNFDITPDAYCEIIFDEKVGDIIRGNGSGKIRMQIDTKGDFTMFGDYVISKGAYNFTLLNAVNKAFTIEPGGTVTWSGNPYGGILNLKAKYKQTASILPLLYNRSTKEKESPEARRRHPVTVLMKLTGNLFSPEINLGMDFENFPQNSAYYVDVMEFKNRIAANEQELNRQVFSLLILQRLSEEGGFNGQGSGIQGSISEFLTNQLSYWASQVNENLQIDLNLNGLDQEAWNAFQLRLSYAALDGRLRITRDGGFTTVQNSSQATTSARAVSVIGDWTIEYILNKEGSLRVKMFNRNSQGVMNTANFGATTGVVAGFSLLHTQSFNALRELFRRRRAEQVIEEQKANEAQPQTNTGKGSKQLAADKKE